MRQTRLSAAVVLMCGLVLFAARPALTAGQRSTPTLDILARNTQALTDYAVTIDGHEVDGERTDDRIMRFRFRKPNQAKLEVVKGQAAGMRLLWSGGPKVHVRGGIFSWLPVWLDLHDPRITSLRGNTMLRAEFEPSLDCFLAHRDLVAESPGPRVDGQPTVVISMQSPSGVSCASDSEKDRGVTKDVLTVTRSTATVLRRERYVRDALVERWILSDLKTDSGLTDADFR